MFKDVNHVQIPKAAKRPRQTKARKSSIPVAEPMVEDIDFGADGGAEDDGADVAEVKNLVSLLHLFSSERIPM